MPDTPSPVQQQQALRMKRFLIAAGTYGLGLAILALCSAFGLFAWAHLAWIGALFAVANLGLYAVFRSGWNLRFSDPSITQFQGLLSVTLVVPVWVFGAHILVVAIPFYSAMFVFAMLRLKPRELVLMAAYVSLTYCGAAVLRLALLPGPFDLRVEALHAVLVIVTSIWYTLAAGYISGLRARLRQSLETIQQLASRDGLTNTWNRRHIDLLLAAELERTSRHGTPLCLCMVDLDHFKSINDRFGHPVGDAVLHRVAQAMAGELRATDQLGRFGGEEFLIVLPESTLAEAQACAERLRQSVASLAAAPGASTQVTVSIGLAECLPAESLGSLLSRVDSALYAAKRDGRNRVMVAAEHHTAS